MYTKHQLMKIGKRENNAKRNYLIINPLQGKHIPSSPSDSLALFDALAKKVKENFSIKKTLIIGFAETATAIGSRIAIQCNTYYIQTTRESIGNEKYIYFSETHSHATTQKLVESDIDSIFQSVEEIIFIEDEITTGNTILGIVDILQKRYGKKHIYGVASILNGMENIHFKAFQLRNIQAIYLLKTKHQDLPEMVENWTCDGEYIDYKYIIEKKDLKKEKIFPSFYNFDSSINPRRLIQAIDLDKECKILYQNIRHKISFQDSNKDLSKISNEILLLGTEEFMYPAIYIGALLERDGCIVKTHSTTRSPIEVSKSREYPLQSRYTIYSPYNQNRNTFLYNIKKYSKVIIISDASSLKESYQSLLQTLENVGNQDIFLIKW